MDAKQMAAELKKCRRGIFAYSNEVANFVGFADDIDSAYELCMEYAQRNGKVHDIVYIISSLGSNGPTIYRVNSKAPVVVPMRFAHYHGMVELDAEMNREFALVRR